MCSENANMRVVSQLAQKSGHKENKARSLLTSKDYIESKNCILRLKTIFNHILRWTQSYGH